MGGRKVSEAYLLESHQVNGAKLTCVTIAVLASIANSHPAEHKTSRLTDLFGMTGDSVEPV